SSRRRHTSFSRDWSSDVCSSDLGLNATLRDYQLQGLRWLARMTSLGLGACLADDMGLGKTVTLIALHLHRGTGPTLVVCPASLRSEERRVGKEGTVGREPESQPR